MILLAPYEEMTGRRHVQVTINVQNITNQQEKQDFEARVAFSRKDETEYQFVAGFDDGNSRFSKYLMVKKVLRGGWRWGGEGSRGEGEKGRNPGE